MWVLRLCLATAALFSAAVHAPAADPQFIIRSLPAPVLTNLSTTSGPIGTTVILTGRGFGATQGAGSVVFLFTIATPTAWSDTSITVTVPIGSVTGDVHVNTVNGPSNRIMFTVTTSGGTTRNVTCSNGADITSAMNAAIAASVDGDTIAISAGSCTTSPWNAIVDKNITVQGAGKGNTVITSTGSLVEIDTNGSRSPTWRLTGFTITSTASMVGVITVFANQSASWRGPFRIDHLFINYPNDGPDGAIALYGTIFGLIDHDDFVQSFEAAILTSLVVSTETCFSNGACNVDDTTLAGAFAASQAYQPGMANSGNYLYIEDCTFTANGANTMGFAAIDTGYTGGRFVVRHNAMINVALFAHWTSAGNWNSMWWEIYNNNFNWTANAAGAPFAMRIQGGGTGLIYNNTIQGNWGGNNIFVITEARMDGQSNAATPLLGCDGTHNWDNDAGDVAAPGWPCLTQVGRDAGKTIAQIRLGGDTTRQPSFPLYFWNNGPQVSCSTGLGLPACDNTFVPVGGDLGPYFKSTPHTVTGGGYGQGDVDFCVMTSQPSGCGTHMLTYTPFTYPHP